MRNIIKYWKNSESSTTISVFVNDISDKIIVLSHKDTSKLDVFVKTVPSYRYQLVNTILPLWERDFAAEGGNLEVIYLSPYSPSALADKFLYRLYKYVLKTSKSTEDFLEKLI